MNKVILMGRLTKDPEVRHGNNPESMMARFTLAIDRRKKTENGPSADFPSCVGFGKTAEFIEKYAKKGTKFIVEGRISTGSYKKESGETVYTTDVIIESIEFAESKNSGSSADKEARDQAMMADNDGFMNIPEGIEEDLPFAAPTRG